MAESNRGKQESAESSPGQSPANAGSGYGDRPDFYDPPGPPKTRSRLPYVVAAAAVVAVAGILFSVLPSGSDPHSGQPAASVATPAVPVQKIDAPKSEEVSAQPTPPVAGEAVKPFAVEEPAPKPVPMPVRTPEAHKAPEPIRAPAPSGNPVSSPAVPAIPENRAASSAPNRCVHFRGCVDGSEVLSIVNGVLRLQHRHFSPVGTHDSCPANLRVPGGGFFLNGVAYPAAALVPVMVRNLKAVQPLMARGKVYMTGPNQAIVDDDAEGAAAEYDVDLCGD